MKTIIALIVIGLIIWNGLGPRFGIDYQEWVVNCEYLGQPYQVTYISQFPKWPWKTYQLCEDVNTLKELKEQDHVRN